MLTIYLKCSTRTNINSRYPKPIPSHLQLRIPRRPIRRLQHPLPPIPEERAQLEPLLAAADRVHAALVPEVDVLADRQPDRVLVRQDRAARRPRLAHHARRPHLVQEAVVDAARIPRVDAVRAPERRVADERVPPAVVVVRSVVRAVVVLLRLG